MDHADTVINSKQVAIDLKLPGGFRKAAAALWDVDCGDEVGCLVMNQVWVHILLQSRMLQRNQQLAFKHGFNQD